jgi:membrane protease subunit HflK
MERILGASDKLVYDGSPSQGIVPYLPLSELTSRRQNPPAANPPAQGSTGGAR